MGIRRTARHTGRGIRAATTINGTPIYGTRDETSPFDEKLFNQVFFLVWLDFEGVANPVTECFPSCSEEL